MENKKKAFLILEDGTVFTGISIGAEKEITSELVFNTSMAGYVDVLTDPSYAGKAVCMTYSLIGNYGVCLDDLESKKAWVDGLIVRELSRIPSNFREDISIQQFLKEQNVTGIANVDTRALTKILRDKGSMNCRITTNIEYDLKDILNQLKTHKKEEWITKVTCDKKYTVAGVKTLKENGWQPGFVQFDAEAYKNGEKEMPPCPVQKLNGIGKQIAILDLGIKKSLISAFTQRGVDVTVYPALTSAKEILSDNPDGILVSSGPDDIVTCEKIKKEILNLMDSKLPIFAIGVGHQLVALAAGASIYQLTCGHRGSNHPVKEISTGKVTIVSQNQGYTVDPDTMKENIAVSSYINVNDGTNEGFDYINKDIMTVQFYPDTYTRIGENGTLYDRFISMMEGKKNA